MFRDARKLKPAVESRSSLKNRRGQVLLETLVIAVFLAGFFTLLLAFTGEQERSYQKTTWSRKGSR